MDLTEYNKKLAELHHALCQGVAGLTHLESDDIRVHLEASIDIISRAIVWAGTNKTEGL